MYAATVKTQVLQKTAMEHNARKERVNPLSNTVRQTNNS